MGDHEVELSAKFGVPEFHGFVANAEARYKGTWSKRAKKTIEQTSERAGLTVDQLEERLQADDRVSDVFRRALSRSTEQSDEQYNDVLARLVAAALDPAKIEETDYLVGQLCRLEPLHVRVLLHGFTFWDREVQPDTGGEVEQVRPEEAVWAASRHITRNELQERLGLSHALAQSAIDVLVAAGFLMRYERPSLRVPGRNGEPDRPRFKFDDEWTPTSSARAAIDHVFPNVAGTG